MEHITKRDRKQELYKNNTLQYLA